MDRRIQSTGKREVAGHEVSWRDKVARCMHSTLCHKRRSLPTLNVWLMMVLATGLGTGGSTLFDRDDARINAEFKVSQQKERRRTGS